jgi:hypothetical protein
MSKVYVKRNLKYYSWSIESEGNNLPYLVIHDKRNDITIKIDKVYTMSLHKFIPNYLDKLRILQGKSLRTKMSKMKKKYKESMAKQKAKVKAVKNRQASLFTKARKVKNERETRR